MIIVKIYKVTSWTQKSKAEGIRGEEWGLEEPVEYIHLMDRLSTSLFVSRVYLLHVEFTSLKK
jgi:hypothetical protein